MDKKECYELSLTSNYVSDWNFSDAIRELIQNGVDQETIDSKNKFKLSYDKNKKQLTLRSPLSKLKRSTLLLGNSSKSNDEKTIGQFGEGYKIASLVLTRLGKNITIYNNEKNEKWTCRFKNSTKWLDKIFAFYIEENKTEDTGLDIVVDNVEQDDMYDLYDLWINCDPNEWDRISTTYGEILKDEELSGRIYVNGLFVCEEDRLHYGFNFKPKYIELERDRKTCSSWDIGMYTSKMIMEAGVSGDLDLEEISYVFNKESRETEYVGFNRHSNNAKEIAKKMLEVFDKKNPVKSVPVKNQSQMEKVKALGGNPIIVNSRIADLLEDEIQKRIEELSKNIECGILTLKERLNFWLTLYKDRLSDKAITEMEEIIKSVE